MSPERSLLYENALWLVDRMGEEADTGSVDAVQVMALAQSLGALLLTLRRGEPRRLRAWERALERHHLSLVRGA